MKETRKVKNITLKHYSSILRPALRLAVKEKLLYQNPYDFMPAIKKEKCPHDYFNQSEMEEFFKIIKGHKLELAFKVLA